jgi:hypothetical protein
MEYTRKTKDVYYIVWNGEEIDQAETRQEARYLVKEYNTAFKSGCSIKTKRLKITN